ncbi:MAG TPA: FtsX-like permease family protein [Candidatus Polarisedimenticolia bacterium]|nr:FtsX-like permease family protein [Candidatus Polarisedimenticolia bacterium]
MTLWRFAARNIARNRRRTVLTLGVVVFGFAAIALAGGFMAQNLDGLAESTIRSGMGHLQIASPGGFEDAGGFEPGRGLEDAERIAAILRGDAAVKEILPRLEFVGLVSDGRRSVPFLGIGVDPIAEARHMDAPQTIASGRWLADRDERAVVLGGGLAKALGAKAGDGLTLLATGVDGTLNAVDAAVAGIVHLPIKELDDRWLATGLTLADDLLAAGGRVSRIAVVLGGSRGASAAGRRIEARLREAGLEVEVRPWEALAPFYRQVRILYLGIFGFMGIVLVVVVLLATANTMMMAAAERTREIGTLRAIGTRPSLIRGLFLREGILLAVAGSVLGALLSLLIRTVLNHSGLTLPPPPGGTQGMPLHVQAYAVAYAAAAVAMLLTLAFASWLPARRASRVPIVEALTHV